MSDVLYPLSLIGSLVSTPFAPVIGDEFRDGTTSTRRLWPAQYFKRQLQISHAPMSRAEFQYLRSFYSQRSGMYDSFWFRDNVHADGNLKVRFAQPVPRQFQGSAYVLQVDLDEVAPVRALVEGDEVLAAAGTAPALFWDPCRELYYSHTGTIFSASQVNDSYVPNASSPVAAVLQAGAFTDIFKGTVEQAQYFRANGTAWAKSAANVAGISGTQPAVSLFCFARHSATATTQALFTVGSSGTNSVIGIGMHTSGDYSIYLGTSLNYQANASNNTGGATPDTWRSLALTTTINTNQELFYANGSLLLTENSAARSYAAGPATLGANSAGTDKANPGAAMAKADLAQCLVFVGAQLSLAQIKALHNLFAPLYGVALVS